MPSRLSSLPFDQAFEKRDQLGNEVQQRRRDGQLCKLLSAAVFLNLFYVKGVSVMAKRNPKDINKKLRSLTREQAEALYQQLNSAYTPENLPTAEDIAAMKVSDQKGKSKQGEALKK